MAARAVTTAAAYAPSHVTGIVVPSTGARDPRARGSLGAGLVLDIGVRADATLVASPRPWAVAHDRRGAPLAISTEVARRLLAGRRARLSVRLTHGLPVGQGFGTSAAGAVATALACAELLDLPRRRALETAHLADLFGGGGLGGVAAILGGGLETRTRPGIPPWGRVLRTRYPGRLVVGTVGPPLRTRTVLRSADWRKAFSAGPALFDRLRGEADPDRFWDVSAEFTEAAGLLSPPLRAVLRALRRRGVRASQAMFGSSFFAELPDAPADRPVLAWLSRRAPGVTVCRVAPPHQRPNPVRSTLSTPRGATVSRGTQAF